jgi:hypothetical protein
MDVGFGHAAIAAQFAPSTHALLLCQAHDALIDAVQGGRTNQTLARLERAVIRAGVVGQRTEQSPLQTAVDFGFGTAIAPVVQTPSDGRTQRHDHRSRRSPIPERLRRRERQIVRR